VKGKQTLPSALRRFFSNELLSMSLPPILSSDRLTEVNGDCEPILVSNNQHMNYQPRVIVNLYLLLATLVDCLPAKPRHFSRCGAYRDAGYIL
jgi:hypothetical protein